MAPDAERSVSLGYLRSHIFRTTDSIHEWIWFKFPSFNNTQPKRVVKAESGQAWSKGRSLQYQQRCFQSPKWAWQKKQLELLELPSYQAGETTDPNAIVLASAELKSQLLVLLRSILQISLRGVSMKSAVSWRLEWINCSHWWILQELRNLWANWGMSWFGSQH